MKKNLFISIICLIGWASGCTYETIETSLCDNPPKLDLISVKDSECNTPAGRIEVTANGGTGSLEYSIDGTAFQSTPVFENLSSGSYTITVRDGKQCTSTLDVEVANANGMNINVVATPSGCGTADGVISITAGGGKEPYQFKLGAGSFGSVNQFKSLVAGSYEVTVKDATGCAITKKVSIITGLQFSAVRAIISASCATSSCHGGNISPDFRKDQNIINNASIIATRTANKSMPPTGPISDDKIKSIACWVKDGASAN